MRVNHTTYLIRNTARALLILQNGACFNKTIHEKYFHRLISKKTFYFGSVVGVNYCPLLNVKR